MKKYLITAAMAVAVSGALVSCHDDEITGSAVEQKIQAFEDLFVQAFGKPDPNHTWGFGDPIVVEEARTRAEVNVNGNLWNSRPALGETEEADVLKYMDMTLAEMTQKGNKYSKEFPVNLVNYFVTQVHTGDDKYGTAQSPNNKTVLGSSKMNNLHIAMVESAARPNSSIRGALPGGEGDWEHVNNFNAGTSQDWGGNTMFINSGTFDFAYESSEDSKYHNRWIVVKGSDIDAAKYGNYYYVCFDFEGVPNECITYYDFYYTDERGSRQHGNGQLNGYFETLQDIKNAGITSLNDGAGRYINVNNIAEADFTINRWGQDNMLYRGDNNYSDWIIRLVAATPKVDIPKVKVPTATGGKTTRVIKSGEQVVQSGRVFCEDIVAAQYDLKDLDYNDVVFDAAIVNKYRKLISTSYDEKGQLIETKIDYEFTGIDGQENGYDEYYAKVCLLAAGGTLPISIQIGQDNEIQFNGEIHNILGKKSSSIMINTLSKDERERVNMATVDYNPAVDLTHKVDGVTTDKFALDKKKVIDINRNIKLDVQYGNVATTIEKVYYNGQKDVVASAKFMVPLGTPWAKERVNIATAYPQFINWVGNETNEDGTVKYPFWNYPSANVNFYFDPEGDDLNVIQGLDPAVWSKDNFITQNGTTYTVSEETTTQLPDINGISISEAAPQNPVFTIPDNQTETILYDFTIPTVGPGYLYDGNQVTVASDTQITTGSKIRIYGVSTEGWEVTFDDQTKSASNGGRYSTNGYIEFDVTSNIGKRLQITGKNFTITYITQVNSTLWSGETVFNDDWKETIVIDAGKFTNAKAGDIVRVYIRNKGSNYNPIFKHVDDWSDWTGFQGNIDKNSSNEYFQAPIPSDGLNELKSKGLRFQGIGFTATKIVLIPGS